MSVKYKQAERNEKELKKMKTDMNLNELEQVNGGNFLDDIKDALKKIIPNPFEPPKPVIPIPKFPEPVIAKKDPVFPSMPELG